jgi:hypothetical protein
VRVVGIDPGVQGAVAYIADSETIVRDLPTYAVSTTHQIDPLALSEILGAYSPELVVVEDNRAQGRNGSMANFSMGFSMGTILAVVTLLRLPLLRVKPSEWQRGVGLGSVPGASRKNASRARAQEMWPNLLPELKRVADHNRAEALLIAEYGRKVS